VRCALELVDAVVALGVQIRAGVHTGEVVVSSTVKDLLAGRAVTFQDRGGHELKGAPGSWRLFAACQNATSLNAEDR
jgi:class 3 adenylate cyclase